MKMAKAKIKRHVVSGKNLVKLKSRNHLAVIVACTALITVGLVLLFYSLYAVYKVYDVDMRITVSDRSAFNTDTGAIDFGKTLPGNANTRTIVMSHDYSKPLLIHFRKTGNISQFVQTPEDFYLEPGVTKEIALNAIVPKGTPLTTYEGSMRVYFRRI